MSKELLQQLKKIRNQNNQINPDVVWVKENRERMLRQISNTVEEEKQSRFVQNLLIASEIFLPNRIFATARPMIMMLLVLCLTAGGWMVSASADESLPGDALWGVKVATENIKLAIAPEQNKVKIKMEIANTRINEVSTLLSNKKPEAVDNAALAIKSLKKNMESTKDDLHTISKSNTPTEKVAEVVKDLSNQTEQITLRLATLTKDESVGADLQKQAVETKKVVDDVGMRALEVGLDNKISEQDLKSIVEKKIQGIVRDAEETKKMADAMRVNVVSPTASSSTVNSTATSTKDNINPNSSSTLQLQPVISVNNQEIANKVAEVKEQVIVTADAMKKATEDAKGLLSENKFTEVVDIIKEIKVINNETTGALVEVKNAVLNGNDSLPPVPAINTIKDIIPATTTAPSTTVIKK